MTRKVVLKNGRLASEVVHGFDVLYDRHGQRMNLMMKPFVKNLPMYRQINQSEEKFTLSRQTL